MFSIAIHIVYILLIQFVSYDFLVCGFKGKHAMTPPRFHHDLAARRAEVQAKRGAVPCVGGRERGRRARPLDPRDKVRRGKHTDLSDIERQMVFRVHTSKPIP